MRPGPLHPIASACSQGNPVEANPLLQDYLAQPPLDDEAWFQLSQATVDPVARAECLVRVLESWTAQAGLPGGHTDLAKRLRRLADRLERPVPGPHANLHRALTWAGRTLAVALLIVVMLVVGPLALGNRPVIILSGSMEPFIHTGSIVIAQPVPSANLREGDVIAYLPSANEAMPLVHRIVGLRDENGTRYYTTRGDANAANDPNEVALGATAWRYRYSVPVAGYLVTFAASPHGKIVMIALPLLALAGLSVVDWLKRRPAPLLAQPLLSLPTWPSLVQLRALPTRLSLSTLPTLAARLRQSVLTTLLRLSAQSARHREYALAASRHLIAQVRQSALAAHQRLSALADRMRLSAIAALRRQSTRAALLRWSALRALRELRALVRLRAQPALRELHALPELLALLRQRALPALLRPSARRALRELRELRALLRLPARAALREMHALLRRSIVRELHGLRRLPALRHLRTRLGLP